MTGLSSLSPGDDACHCGMTPHPEPKPTHRATGGKGKRRRGTDNFERDMRYSYRKSAAKYEKDMMEKAIAGVAKGGPLVFPTKSAR